MRKTITTVGILLLGAIIAKAIGLIREVAIAYIFGASGQLAAYIALRAITDSLLVFAGGTALQGSIVPLVAESIRTTGQYYFARLRSAASKTGLVLSLASFVLAVIGIESQLGSLGQIQKTVGYLMAIVLSMCTYLIITASVGLLGLQGRAQFARYAFINSANPLIALLLLLPLSLIGILGAALSRLSGAITQEILTWKSLGASTRQNEQIRLSDPSFKKIIQPWEIAAWNAPIIILLLGRIIVGFTTQTDVVYYNYALIILLSGVSLITYTTSAIILERRPSSSNRIIVLRLSLILLGVCALLYFLFGNYIFPIVEFLFARGEFTSMDARRTADLVLVLAPAFMILLSASFLIQYCFSNPTEAKDMYVKLLASFSIIVPAAVFSIVSITGLPNTVTALPGLTIGVAIIYMSFSFHLVVGIIWFFSLKRDGVSKVWIHPPNTI